MLVCDGVLETREMTEAFLFNAYPLDNFWSELFVASDLFKEKDHLFQEAFESISSTTNVNLAPSL